MAKARVGRPRSEKSREAILDAAQDLLQETGGVGVSIEAIARRAGVGKPTIYRWWPSLADIVLEGLLDQADKGITVPSSDSLREKLRHFLGLSMEALDWCGVHLRFLMAQAQMDEEFRERFRENFVANRRAALKSVFQQAREQGDIAPDRNLDLLVDAVFGAMWYRLLVGHGALDQAFADALTELAMGMVQAGSEG